MRPNIKTIAATLAGVSLLGGAFNVAAKTDLDGDAIKALHTRAEIDAVTHQGRAFVAKFYGNGRMDGTIAGDATNVDTGTWSVVNNRLCWKWFKWDNGVEKCYTIEDLGDGRYKGVQEGGVGTTTYTVKKID